MYNSANAILSLKSNFESGFIYFFLAKIRDMSDFSNQCFVYRKTFDLQITKRNIQFNLTVCNECKGTDREKKAID